MYCINKFIESLYFKQVGNLALYDQLTELYNYNWLDKIGKIKYMDADCYVTVIDLNNFKQINDTYGHSYGNDIIKNVADQLRRIKSVDATADVLRYGGDEFVIFSTVDIAKVIDEDEKSSYTDLFSYGTYHKSRFDSINYAFNKADELMYYNKRMYKEKLSFNAPMEIDISIWKDIYHIINNIIYDRMMNFVSFEKLRRYTIGKLNDEQIKNKDKYIEQFNMMQNLYNSVSIPGNSVGTISKFKCAIGDTLINSIK